MSFKRFNFKGRSFVPRVTINKIGNLALNSAAQTRFGLSEYKYAVLFYDADTARVGIILTNDSKEEGRRTLRQRPTGADISASAFLDYFEIPRTEARTFDLSKDDQTGYLVFNTRRGRQRGRRRQAATA